MDKIVAGGLVYLQKDSNTVEGVETNWDQSIVGLEFSVDAKNKYTIGAVTGPTELVLAYPFLQKSRNLVPYVITQNLSATIGQAETELIDQLGSANAPEPLIDLSDENKYAVEELPAYSPISTALVGANGDGFAIPTTQIVNPLLGLETDIDIDLPDYNGTIGGKTVTEILLSLSSADSAYRLATDALLDNKITPQEKSAFKDKSDEIVQEYQKLIDAATAYQLNVSEFVTPYTTAYNNLTSVFTPIFADMSATESGVSKSTIKTAITNYYLKREVLKQKLSLEAKKRAEWNFVNGENRPEDNATVGAPNGTPVGNTTAEAVYDGVIAVARIASDGFITPTEKMQLKPILEAAVLKNTILTEYPDGVTYYATKLAAYQGAYQALYNYFAVTTFPTAIDSGHASIVYQTVFADMTSTINIGINGYSSLKDILKNYYAAETGLENAIYTRAATLAESFVQVATDFNEANNRDDSAITALPQSLNLTHVLNPNGSCNLTLTFAWNGVEGSIDGFVIFAKEQGTNQSYVFGSNPSDHTFVLTADRRSITGFGFATKSFYTVGVCAYRRVDKSINQLGVIRGPIIQAGPYQPSTTSNITSDINGVSAANISSTVQKLSDINSDGKLTPDEKIELRRKFSEAVAEKEGIIAQANSLSITTELTTYLSSFQALADYLNNGTAWSSSDPFWLNSTNISLTHDVVGLTLDSKINDFIVARTKLLQKATDVAKTKADWTGVNNRPIDLTSLNTTDGTKLAGIQAGATVGAPNGTNVGSTPAQTVESNAATALANANNAVISAANANAAIADIAADNKLTPSEKSAIRGEWDIISAEKSGIEAQATSLGITTEKTAYTSGFAALATYLNAGTAWVSGVPSWVSDVNLSTTTSIVGADLRAAVKTYYDARTALFNKFAAMAATKAVYANVTGTPTTLADVNSTEGAKLTGIQNEATKGSPAGTLINGVLAETVQSYASNSFTGTTKYRATGGPTNTPTPTGATVTANTVGGRDIRLDWSAYTQGANQADLLYLFFKEGSGTPTIADASIAFNVNTSSGSYYIFQNVDATKPYTAGIAAGRRTENGIEFGSIVTHATWTISEGAANNAATSVGGQTATNVASTVTDTSTFRTSGAPTNQPTLSTAIVSAITAGGTVDIRLPFTYTQGALPADEFICYFVEGTTAPTTANAVAGKVSKNDREFFFQGVPADKNYRAGIVASRNTSSGPISGSIVTGWSYTAQTVTLDAGKLAGVTASVINTNITNAQNTANTAIANAANAQNSATTVNALVADMYSDGKLTPEEKINLRRLFNEAVAGKSAIISQATGFGITTELTAFNTRFQALADYLNNGTTWASGDPFWLNSTNISITHDVVGVTLDSKINEFLIAQTALFQKVADVAATKATWGSGTIANLPTPLAGVTNSDAVKNSVISVNNSTGILSGIANDVSVGNNVDGFIRYPIGGNTFTYGTSGALRITLPMFNSNTMLRFTVDIFEYATGYTCTIVIGGYNYETGLWVAVSANIFGSKVTNYPVYFGNDGVKNIIWIGDTTESWSYTKVQIKDVSLALSNVSKAAWESGWVVDFSSSTRTNVTNQVIQTLPASHWDENVNRPANLASLTGSELLKNSDIVINDAGKLLNIGTANIVVDNTKQLFNQIADRPTDLVTLNNSDGTKLAGIQSEANKTYIDASGTIQGVSSGSGITVQNSLLETLSFVTRNVTVFGNTFKKTGGPNNTWTGAQAYSRESYVSGAYCSFSPDQNNLDVMCALNTDPANPGTSYNTLDFAWYMPANGILQIYESGYYAGDYGAYAVGDILAITYDGSFIRYYHNGTLKRTVAATITAPLFFDSIIYSMGASVSKVKFGPMSSNAWNSITGQPTPLTNLSNSDTIKNNLISVNASTGILSGIAGDANVGNNVDGFVRAPGGGYYNYGAGALSGAIKIALPATSVYAMLTFTVSIFESVANRSCVLQLSGNVYTTFNTWYNVTATLIGGNTEYPVYFGHDGTKYCVWISETNDSWEYPIVKVSDVLLGLNNSKTPWENGWAISITTAARANVTAQVLDTYPGADWTKNTKRPNNLVNLNGTELLKNSDITVDNAGKLLNIGTTNIVVDNTKQLFNQISDRPTDLVTLNNSDGTKLAGIQAEATKGSPSGTYVGATLAQTVESNANNAYAQAAAMIDDNILSPGTEKAFYRSGWDSLVAQRTGLLAQATSLGVSSSAFTTAFQNLANFLNGGTWSSGIPTYISDAQLGTSTSLNGASGRSLLAAMNAAQTDLQSALDAKAATVSTWAGVSNKIANINALTGTENIQNSQIAISSGLINGIGTGNSTAVANNLISVNNSTGILSGIAGDANVGNNIDGFVRAPGGGYYNNSAFGVAGAIKITLPTIANLTASRLTFTVTIFEYSTNCSCILQISGLVYAPLAIWYSVTATLIGGNTEYPVYFGHNGSAHCVWIGVTTNSWEYPTVKVSDVLLDSDSLKTDWENGWAISITTAARTNVTAQVLDTYPGADWTKNTKRPTNLAALAGTEAIQNTQISINGSGQIAGIGTGNNTPVSNSLISVDNDGNLINIGNVSPVSVGNNVNGLIRNPGGGTFKTTTASFTGALKITLPVYFTNTMLKFTVDIFEYSTGLSCTLSVAGYTSSSTTWVNVTASVIGGNTEYPVYFGHDGSKCVIWIGDTTETWSYPQVQISNAMFSYDNYTKGMWESGWVISFSSAARTNVTAQVLDTYLPADWSKSSKRPANLAALTGSEGIKNELITVNGSTGVMAGIGTSGVQVDNSKVTLTGLGFTGNAAATKNLVTQSGSNPSGGSSGDLHYNTSTKRWWTNIGGSWTDNQIEAVSVTAAWVSTISLTATQITAGTFTAHSINSNGFIKVDGGVTTDVGTIASIAANQSSGQPIGVYAKGSVWAIRGTGTGSYGGGALFDATYGPGVSASSVAGYGGDFYSTSNRAVNAVSGANHAVYGVTSGGGYSGVAGEGTSGNGLYGGATSGTGVRAVSNTGPAIHASTSGTGVYGGTITGINYGLYVSGATNALYCDGKFTITSTDMVTNLNANFLNGKGAVGYVNFIYGDTGSGSITNGSLSLNCTISGYRFAQSSNTITLEAYASDSRLKEDIWPEIFGKDFILNLKPVSYRYKSNPKIRHHGFIANNMAEFTGDFNDALSLYDEARDIYGTDYMSYIAPIVKTLQQAFGEIDELRKSVAELKQIIQSNPN